MMTRPELQHSQLPVPSNIHSMDQNTTAAAEALITLATLPRDQDFAPATSIATNDGTELRSTFTPDHLRGTKHYQASHATWQQDNLGKFLEAISRDPVRAGSVLSVKLDQIWDNFLNSGFTELLNREVLPYYALTDDASTGAYTVFTETALTFKAYQRQMADSRDFVGHPLRPTDFTLLKKDFLDCAEFGEAFLEPLLDLFIKLCPKLEVIHIPAKWCPHNKLPFNRATMDRWRDVHGWDLRVKEYVEDDFIRLGRKGGWSAAHIQRWLQELEGDIAKNG